MTTNTNTKANQQPVDDNNDDNDKNNQNDSTNLFLAVSFLFLLFLLDFCFKNNPILSALDILEGLPTKINNWAAQ